MGLGFCTGRQILQTTILEKDLEVLKKRTETKLSDLYLWSASLVREPLDKAWKAHRYKFCVFSQRRLSGTVWTFFLERIKKSLRVKMRRVSKAKKITLTAMGTQKSIHRPVIHLKERKDFNWLRTHDFNWNVCKELNEFLKVSRSST